MARESVAGKKDGINDKRRVSMNFRPDCELFFTMNERELLTQTQHAIPILWIPQ